MLAIATWVVGDLAMTFVGLSLGAGETNPLAYTLIGGFGTWILIPLQLLALLDIGGFALFAIAKLAVVAIWMGLFVFVDRLELNQPYVEVVPIVWWLVSSGLRNRPQY